MRCLECDQWTEFLGTFWDIMIDERGRQLTVYFWHHVCPKCGSVEDIDYLVTMDGVTEPSLPEGYTSSFEPVDGQAERDAS